MKKIKGVLNSIDFEITAIFMLLLLTTIEVVGASFARQLKQNSIQNFESPIQVPNIITSQVSSQSSRANSKKANQQLSQIISNYNLGDIGQLVVINNKGVIRAVSNVSDRNRIRQRTSNADIKNVLSNGEQVPKVVNNNGNYMVQISPLVSANGTNTPIGAIYVHTGLQDVSDNLRQISIYFLVASLVAAVLGTVVTLVISRAITRPIEEMHKQALRIANGDYSGYVRVYMQNELGQLAEAFNTLSVRVERTQEISDSERRRLDNALTHVTNGIIATDGHGNITAINEMVPDFLGRAEKDVAGKPIINLLGLKDVIIQDLLGTQQELVVRVNDNTHDEIILHVNFSLIQRVIGFVSGLVCVLRDITQRQEDKREQQQFVPNASHELRAPLTNLRAYVGALNDGAWKDPNIALQFLHVVQDETERVARMINDLLSLSRTNRGVARMDLEWVNLDDFVDHVLNRFDMMLRSDSDKIHKKKYTIKCEFPHQALWVEINTDKMMQVIDSIMSNAVKYSPDGGVITVRLLQTQKHVILSISDQGLGIPRKDLSKVFDRLYHVDKARSRKQGGTGLGLTISKEMIEAHHGRIWADGAEGTGSTFYISLPCEAISEEGED